MSEQRNGRHISRNGIVGGLLLFVGLVIFGPSFVRVLFSGQPRELSISCQSNLKQLGIALTQYEQDNDGIQPPMTARGGWRKAVFPYVESFDVYECPDDAQVSGVSSTNFPRSYAANHLGPDSHGQERGAFSGQDEPLVNLFHLERPATTVLLADARGDQAEQWNLVSPVFLPQMGGRRELHVHVPQHIFFNRPAGALNVLMGDGHVKALPPMKTLTPVNLWTRDNAPFTGQDLSNARAILKHAQDE